MNIYHAITQVMSEIGAVGKTHTNTQGAGYKFRGIDDLYNATQAALIKAGVFSVPTVLEMTREERTSKAGGLLLWTTLRIKYIFYAGDGSSVEAVTMGEAMDSGDKSCNKAMSAAQKYAFLQIFAIPTEETKDTENETHEVKHKAVPGDSSKGKTPAVAPEMGGSLPPSPTKDGEPIIIQVKEITENSGSKNGKPWKSWTIISTEGDKFGTFSGTFAKEAARAEIYHLLVELTHKPATKYGKEIISLSVPAEDDIQL